MRVTKNDDGTITATEVPREAWIALAHIAADLGARHAVLRYSPMFSKWSRPNRSARKALSAFAKRSRVTYEDGDFFDRFESLEKPKFRKAVR